MFKLLSSIFFLSALISNVCCSPIAQAQSQFNLAAQILQFLHADAFCTTFAQITEATATLSIAMAPFKTTLTLPSLTQMATTTLPGPTITQTHQIIGSSTTVLNKTILLPPVTSYTTVKVPGPTVTITSSISSIFTVDQLVSHITLPGLLSTAITPTPVLPTLRPVAKRANSSSQVPDVSIPAPLQTFALDVISEACSFLFPRPTTTLISTVPRWTETSTMQGQSVVAMTATVLGTPKTVQTTISTLAVNVTTHTISASSVVMSVLRVTAPPATVHTTVIIELYTVVPDGGISTVVTLPAGGTFASSSLPALTRLG